MALGAVLKNICSFVEILNSSRSPSVANWDRQSLCNAFQWAAYCEQIYIQSQDKPYRSDLDREIQKLGKLLQRKEISVTEVSLNDLQHGLRLLVANLLQNQDLRPDTLSSLLSPALPAQVRDLCVEECAQLVHRKATRQLLSVIDKSVSNSEHNENSAAPRLTESRVPESLVTALIRPNAADDDDDLSDVRVENFDSLEIQCVSKLLLCYLSTAVKDENENDRLKLKLMSLIGQNFLGQCILVTSYLSLVSRSANSSVKKVLEECLIMLIRSDKRFLLKIPSHHLVCICNSSFKFYRHYIRYLVKCCDDMKPTFASNMTCPVDDLHRIVSWRPTTATDCSTTSILSFNRLVDCFSSLLSFGSSQVASATEQLLQCFVKRRRANIWTAIVSSINTGDQCNNV